MNIEQLRTAGIGRVREMLRPAGQLPGQPAVDGAEGQFTPFRSSPELRVTVQQPGEFGPREIRIDHQAGAAPQFGLVAVRSQASAGIGCATVLPDDGWRHRHACRAVPQHRRFALVGYPHGDEIGCMSPGLVQNIRDGCLLAGPDLLGIVFYPP